MPFLVADRYAAGVTPSAGLLDTAQQTRITLVIMNFRKMLAMSTSVAL